MRVECSISEEKILRDLHLPEIMSVEKSQIQDILSEIRVSSTQHACYCLNNTQC